MARPSAFKPEYVEQAKKLAATLGATDAEIALFFGVSERAINRWKLAQPEFAKALKVGKKPANERVKRSLYLRAVGYSHPAEEVFCSNGKVTRVQTVKHYPPDTGAIVFFLCNREPDEWKQKQQHELTGKNGGPIQSITSPVSAEELRTIAAGMADKV